MCISPIWIKVDNAKSNRVQRVPCGKCPECVKSIQNEWMSRIYFQLQATPKSCFFTLTYRDDTVPFVVNDNTGEIQNSVYKSDLQLALKRFRTSSGLKFKYFICSEYGPKTKRPHYHGIFFGLSYRDALPFFTDWMSRFGFAKVDDITFGRQSFQCVARYVSKYCLKSLFDNKPDSIDSKPTFRLISKGIGVDFLSDDVVKSLKRKPIYDEHGNFTDEYLDGLSRYSRLKIGDFSYKLPRYYAHKIFKEQSRLSLALTDFVQRRNESLSAQKLEQLQALHPDWSDDEAYHLLAVQEVEQAKLSLNSSVNSLANFYQKSKF